MLEVYVKLASAVIALVPVPVNIELSARLVAPVPPFATGNVPVTSLAKSIDPEGLADLTILLFESRPRLPPLAMVPESTFSK